MMQRALPLLFFMILVGFFSYRLWLIDEGNTPNLIPSVMINKPAPSFDLPILLNSKQHFQTSDLMGHVTLVNFFASWCLPCRAEHAYLSALAHHNEVVLVGVNYKNNGAEAKDFLKELGNPYALVAVDRNGLTAIDFGVYGVPESYLVDKQGVIRFKYAGPMTPDVIEQQVLPLIQELNK